MENQVNIDIKAKSIYMHSLSIIEFISEKKFSVKISNEIISLKLGKSISNGYIEAIKKANYYVINLETIGLFSERKIINDINNPLQSQLGNHYGMRFYPFISSSVKSTIKIKGGIVRKVEIALPDQFRSIFFKSKVFQNEKKAQIRHSYDSDISKYVFSWTVNTIRSSNENKLTFDIPFRLGGANLERLIKFPVYYWIISLFGIFVTAFTQNFRFVIAAVAATWLFMVERWTKSNLPQQNTILTYFYLMAGLITAVWGGCMSFNHANYCLPFYISTGFTLLIILGFVTILFRLINYFKLEGALPYKLAFYYAKRIIKEDNKRQVNSINSINAINDTTNSTNNMKMENTLIKSSFWENFQEVVYKLIYPALLGSMLYAIFYPSTEYRIFKIGIVILYLLDYYHLYTYMDKKFTKKQKTRIYVLLDFIVSLLLCTAFNVKYKIAFPCLCFLPICFAIYTCELKIKMGNIPIWSMHVLMGLCAIVTSICFWNRLELIAPFFIGGLIVFYFLLMCIEKTHNPINYDEYIEFTSNKTEKNKYRVYITGRTEELFENAE